MSDSVLKFANKLEIRYSLNSKSNYTDAMTKHRCEKEILTLIRSLADMLGVKLTAYNEPYDKGGGFCEKLGVTGESNCSISIVLNLVMRILTRPSLSVGGQPLMDCTPADEEEMQRELSKLRRKLRLKTPGTTSSHRLIDLLNASPRFYKCRSNFYEALKGHPKVTKILVRELNEKDRSRSGSLEVKRDQFDYFILRSDDLPTVRNNKATIEIIPSVLKDSKYRWKGIYNKGGETIGFYMRDEDFKKQMFEDKVSFTNGMCIDCALEIVHRLLELGEVANVSYTVTTVVRTRFDKMEIVIPQGKRHLRKLEAAKKQLTLDLFG